MASNQSVWGTSNSWDKQANHNNKTGNSVAFGQKSFQSFGPFGSSSSHGNSSGPASLPTMGFRNQAPSSIHTFELNRGSAHTSASMLTLDMDPKMCSWSISSGGSSRASSGQASLDWSGTVDGVFREEIQKMSEGQGGQVNVWR